MNRPLLCVVLAASIQLASSAAPADEATRAPIKVSLIERLFGASPAQELPPFDDREREETPEIVRGVGHHRPGGPVPVTSPVDRASPHRPESDPRGRE